LKTLTDPSPPPGQPVFEARQLRKVYHTGELDVVALNGVDIEFFNSELVVLLGASGSGKSTLLNILGGLDVPTSGELSYKGWDLTNADERTLTLFRRIIDREPILSAHRTHFYQRAVVQGLRVPQVTARVRISRVSAPRAAAPHRQGLPSLPLQVASASRAAMPTSLMTTL